MESSGFTIEPMAEEHLEEILRLERASFSDPWSLHAFRQEVQRAPSGGYARVLRCGGTIQAYLVAWMVAEEAHLANIAVAAEHRRRGYARALIDDLLEEARRRRCRMIWLEVRASNQGAIRLYESYDFHQVAVRKDYYTREREDAVVMLRALEGDDDAMVQ